MRADIRHITRVLILIGAVLGLALSIFGLLGLWASKAQVSASLTDVVDLGARTASATSTMLEVVSDSLDQAGTNLALIESILDDTAATIGESNSLVDTTAGIMGKDLPDFVSSTQIALSSVQTTSRVIDDTLGTISGLWLIGPALTQGYTPEVPLADSVGAVKTSLEPLPASFATLQRELEVASASLATVQSEVAALSEQIGKIDASIESALLVVGEYQLILTELNERLTALQTRLPALINAIYLALTLVLVWLGISQLGVLLQAAGEIRT